MYVVLMAMLALNVSNEVLNGFSIVEESLNRTTSNSAKENLAIYEDFETQMKANPQKTKEWYDKAQSLRQMCDSLYNFAAELKQAIVIEADGKDGNVNDIRNKEDLEAASQVMLSPSRGRGQALYNAINSFRERMLKMVTDEKQKAIIASNLTTEVPSNALGKNWQEYMFESMPAAAAVTLLSKLQSDVRYAEGEVLHTLVQNIDVRDIRVNALEAFVIPNSQTIVRGDKFSAHIVMAAVDTTQVPDIYIGNQKVTLHDNLYERICGATGDFTLAGYLETVNGNGDKIRRDFSQKYTVVDPSATVSADLMNVLYAGYNNPVSISVPGVPLNKITATMSGGTLQPVGPGRYIARPSTVGQDVTFTVMSTNTGHAQQMGAQDVGGDLISHHHGIGATCAQDPAGRQKAVGQGLARLGDHGNVQLLAPFVGGRMPVVRDQAHAHARFAHLRQPFASIAGHVVRPARDQSVVHIQQHVRIPAIEQVALHVYGAYPLEVPFGDMQRHGIRRRCRR